MLRQNGFAAEAARILIRREDKQRAAASERAMDNVGVSLKQELIAFAHLLPPLVEPAFQMDLRLWSPARARFALGGRSRGHHHLVQP
jgi:hypothetical protein